MRREFDLMIGRLDRILSEMVATGKRHKEVHNTAMALDDPDVQTLKHHAEDMILAGAKILSDINANESMKAMRNHIDGQIKV